MSIDEYADRKEIEGEQKEDLFYFVGMMDAAYLEHKGKKLESKTKPAPTSKKGVKKK